MIKTNNGVLNVSLFSFSRRNNFKFLLKGKYYFFKVIAQSYLLSTVDRKTKLNIRQKGMFLTVD